jgi:uncharacterized iron-regulated membrane protein
LPVDELQRRLRAAHPDARPTSIVVQNDPAAAVAFSSGRTGGFYVNPYSGGVRQPESPAMGRFMQTMVEWHRYLGFTGEVSRPRGKWINGACNLAFCVLAVTGLYLWMPRAWTWKALRPVVWFRQNSSSKARDFNWHNTIGFWCAPVLIVLTLTAVPISFQWGGQLINRLTGTPPSAPSAGRGSVSAIAIPAPVPGTQPLSQDALFAIAQKEIPSWQTITLRSAVGGSPGGREAATGGAGATRPASAQAVSFTIRESGTWPRTANTTLALNPFSGDVVRRTGYADLPAAQQVRSWTRFLHTGEALGAAGQFVAGLACLGGLFLVYTGFALSWRRFFGRRPPQTNSTTTHPRARETASVT